MTNYQTKNPQDSARRQTIYVPATLFLLALFVKQFYILPSGSFQLADLCMAVSFLMVFLEQGSTFKIERIDLPLAAFVSFVFVINLCYSILDASMDCSIHTLYYVFNLMAVLLFRRLCTTREFLQRTILVLRLALYTQLAVYLLGMGRAYGGLRYMGTFNDPNQFGFYVFASLLFITVASRKINARTNPIDDVIALVLIFESVSTAMLLGVAALIVAKCVQFALAGSLSRRMLAMLFTVLVAIIVVPIITSPEGESVIPKTGIDTIDYAASRVENKMKKTFTSDGTYSNSLLIDRGLDKITKYPQYLIYGAGEGDRYRFAEAYATNELHSTPLSIWFYYGIVPFTLFCWWIVRNIRKLKRSEGIVVLYLPLLFECLVLANQRQPLFWILIVLASIDIAAKEQPASKDVSLKSNVISSVEKAEAVQTGSTIG